MDSSLFSISIIYFLALDCISCQPHVPFSFRIWCLPGDVLYIIPGLFLMIPTKHTKIHEKRAVPFPKVTVNLATKAHKKAQRKEDNRNLFSKRFLAAGVVLPVKRRIETNQKAGAANNIAVPILTKAWQDQALF
jgi:hypothetical protein